MGGWSRQIIHTPPQIFLKVMELCLKTTINHGNWGGWSKQIILTPTSNILKGNGVVFENFTINHGNGGVVKTNYSYPPPK